MANEFANMYKALHDAPTKAPARRRGRSAINLKKQGAAPLTAQDNDSEPSLQTNSAEHVVLEDLSTAQEEAELGWEVVTKKGKKKPTEANTSDHELSTPTDIAGATPSVVSENDQDLAAMSHDTPSVEEAGSDGIESVSDLVDLSSDHSMPAETASEVVQASSSITSNEVKDDNESHQSALQPCDDVSVCSASSKTPSFSQDSVPLSDSATQDVDTAGNFPTTSTLPPTDPVDSSWKYPKKMAARTRKATTYDPFVEQVINSESGDDSTASTPGDDPDASDSDDNTLVATESVEIHGKSTSKKKRRKRGEKSCKKVNKQAPTPPGDNPVPRWTDTSGIAKFFGVVCVGITSVALATLLVTKGQ